MSRLFLLFLIWRTAHAIVVDDDDDGAETTPSPNGESEHGATWTYPTHTGSASGTSDWGASFPTCGTGKRQSPIDIKSIYKCGLADYPYCSAQKPNRPSNPIVFGGAYQNGVGARVRGGMAQNNGHTVVYTLPDQIEATITGGALSPAAYQLHSFHIHYGSEDCQGSEHTVDGQAYPAELHFIHYNTKYANLSEALEQDDGLAVIGVFLKLGVPNPEFDELKFETLSSEGTSREIQTLFFNNLLPKIRNYYTYPGSLTTPPCSEIIHWIVMQHPIEISTTQMWNLRRIYGQNDAPLENNYRETQSRNLRRIRFFFD